MSDDSACIYCDDVQIRCSELYYKECGRYVRFLLERTQVNHPNWYGGADNPYEAIRVIDAWQLNFCLGNVVKYIARAGKKGDPIEDLRKARWYLDWEIQKLEKSR